MALYEHVPFFSKELSRAFFVCADRSRKHGFF